MHARPIVRLAALLVSALVVASPSPGSAQDVMDLAWDSCDFGPTTMDRSFACDRDDAMFRIVAAFRLGTPMANFYGSTTTLRVTFAGNSVPSWWQTGQGSGGCRAPGAGVFPMDVEYPVAPGCTMPINSFGAFGGYLYQEPSPDPYRTYYRVGSGSSDPATLQANWVYAASRIAMKSSYTVGASPATGQPCPGCEVPACIEVVSIDLYGRMLTQPGTRSFITWQGGNDGHGACPGATPAKRSTWGAVRSLYR